MPLEVLVDQIHRIMMGSLSNSLVSRHYFGYLGLAIASNYFLPLPWKKGFLSKGFFSISLSLFLESWWDISPIPPFLSYLPFSFHGIISHQTIIADVGLCCFSITIPQWMSYSKLDKRLIDNIAVSPYRVQLFIKMSFLMFMFQNFLVFTVLKALSYLQIYLQNSLFIVVFDYSLHWW